MLNGSNVEDAPATEEVIRSVLYFALVMLKKFEANPKGPVYSANFMLYKPIESLDFSEKDELKKRLKFIPEETDVSQLRGILDLVLVLSTTSQYKADSGDTGQNHLTADASLSPFALPLPQTHLTPDKTLWRVLPDAPMAFCTKEIQGCFETKQLMEWCRESGDFSPSVIAAQEEYFKSEMGQNIRSFVSIPLTSGKQDEPLGVLNIHSNCPDLLATREPDRHLWPMFSPYKNMLADLIYKWKIDYKPEPNTKGQNAESVN